MAVGGFAERLAFILELDPSNAVSGMRRVGDAADKELGKTDDRLNKLGGRMQAFGAGAVVAAGVVGRALFGFAQAYEEAAAESRKLDQAMGTNASFAQAGRESFDELAASLQDLTGVDGDAVTGMLGFLGTLGRTAEEAQRAAPLIVDLAQRFGLELEPAARLVNNAMEGNAARLERLIGPLREGESATDALARTVGGFAEGEAQTLQGQLEILKQNLGDVAEGIGGGVVGAVNNMIGPLKSGAEWFTRLDEGTQNTIGSFATYGTAAVGVVGATSFVIGSLLKMVDNFKQAREAIAKFSGAVVQLGTVGAIVTLGTAGAAALDHLEDSLISARISMEDLSRASDEELVRSIDMGVAALSNFGQSADGLYASLAENGVGTLERYRDALEEAGRPTEAITAAIEAEAVAQANATATREAGTEAIEGAEGATDDLTGATGESTVATQDNTAAIQENIDRINERADAIRETLPAEIQLADAMADTRSQLADYNSVMWDATSTAEQRDQAGRDLITAFLSEGDAARANAETQATAAGRADTATREGVDAQIASLFTLAGNLAPGSPVRVQLEDYIRRLNNIPANITTNVRINQSYGQGTSALPTLGQFASGGRPPLGELAVFGEEGPELWVPDTAGTVIPAGQTASIMGGGGPSTLGGGTSFVFAPTINLSGSATTADGERLIEGMRTYVRRNGSSELRSLLGVT